MIRDLTALPVQTINPFYGLDQLAQAGDIENLEPISGVAVSTGLALRGLCDA